MHPCIGLLINLGMPFCRNVLRGIGARAVGRPRCHFLIDNANHERVLRSAAGGRAHGMIANITTQAHADALDALGVPVVNISDHPVADAFPTVTFNNHDVGRAAAEHLLERQLEQFGFVGYSNESRADARRLEGFTARLNEANHPPPRVFQPPTPPNDSPTNRMRHLARWLVDLPKPVGIFTANDRRGRDVLEAAAKAPVNVPNAVAVVSLDSDELFERISYPALSCVRSPGHKVGSEAFALLMRLLAGERPPARPLYLPVMNVEPRLSSDITAIDDEEVAAAVRYIRDNAVRNIQVTDLIEALPISRRSLERRFQVELGRSPQQEIQRVRLEHAQRLLADTRLPIPQVAKRSGFSSADRLAAVFRQHFGLTPTGFRRKYQ